MPHLKQVTLEGPVDALEEAVEETVCFMRLWIVGFLDGVEDASALALVARGVDVVGGVDVANFEVK